MPKMTLKIEGKGNGIMTNIVNMEDVGKSLRVPGDYILKFFGYELGSITKKSPPFIINGKHDQTTMQDLLDK